MSVKYLRGQWVNGGSIAFTWGLSSQEVLETTIHKMHSNTFWIIATSPKGHWINGSGPLPVMLIGELWGAFEYFRTPPPQKKKKKKNNNNNHKNKQTQQQQKTKKQNKLVMS